MTKRILCATLALVLIMAVCGCTAQLAFADSSDGAAIATTIDLTDIVRALIGLMGALVTAYVIPWIRRRTSVAQQQLLRGTVDMLVYGADKLYRTGAIQNKLDYVQTQMRARGFTADRSAIEAAVKRLDLDMNGVVKRLGINGDNAVDEDDTDMDG